MNHLYRIRAIALVTALSGVGAVQADPRTHTQDCWDDHQIREIVDVDGLVMLNVDIGNTGCRKATTSRTTYAGGRRIVIDETTEEGSQVKIGFRR